MGGAFVSLTPNAVDSPERRKRSGHEERNHQGLENRLLRPLDAVGEPHARVKRRQRLGGMLSYYYREAA